MVLFTGVPGGIRSCEQLDLASARSEQRLACVTKSLASIHAEPNVRRLLTGKSKQAVVDNALGVRPIAECGRNIIISAPQVLA